MSGESTPLATSFATRAMTPTPGSRSPVPSPTVLGSTPQVFRHTGDQGDPNHWVNLSGALTAFSAGNKTNVWGSTAQAISSRSRAMIVNPGFRSLADRYWCESRWRGLGRQLCYLTIFTAGFVINLLFPNNPSHCNTIFHMNLSTSFITH